MNNFANEIEFPQEARALRLVLRRRIPVRLNSHVDGDCRRPRVLQVVSDSVILGIPLLYASSLFFFPVSGRFHLSGDLTCSVVYPCDSSVHAKRRLADPAPQPIYFCVSLRF